MSATVTTGNRLHAEAAIEHALFDLDQAQTPVSREVIEAFLAKTAAQLWIQHDYVGNTRLKKAPDYYE